MKIEKLNENQIRCTLTREDLANRELKLSELAYGSEKAKSLFREMMQQAAYEVGFEANDIPLMIEAIPMSADTIILIVTKVEDPEELDTRFAKFAPDNQAPSSDTDASFSPLKMEGADDILNLFQKIRDAQKAASQKIRDTNESTVSANADAETDTPVDITRLYEFERLDDVICTASILGDRYQGNNSLYKTNSGEYRLILSKSQHSPEEFNKICNTVSEYGRSLKYTSGTEAYLGEHGEAIVLADALQKLAQLGS